MKNMTSVIIFTRNHPLQSWELLYIASRRLSTMRGHLAMWNPASSSSSSASWASSSASQQQCDRCLQFSHGIYDIQIQLADVALWWNTLRGRARNYFNKLQNEFFPCVSCFNHPFQGLSLPSRQYQGTASDPFSWQAPRLVQKNIQKLNVNYKRNDGKE